MTFLRRSFSKADNTQQESTVGSDYLWACIKKGKFPESCSQSMRQELENYIPRLLRQTNPNAPSFKQYLMALDMPNFMKEVAWMYYYACLIPEIKALEKATDYLQAAKDNLAISYAVSVGNPFVLNFYCAGLTNQINNLNIICEKEVLSPDQLTQFKRYLNELTHLLTALTHQIKEYPVLACFLLATTSHHLSGCFLLKNNKDFLSPEKEIHYLKLAFFYVEMGQLIETKHEHQTHYLTRGYDLFYGYFVNSFSEYKQFFKKSDKLSQAVINEIELKVKEELGVLV